MLSQKTDEDLIATAIKVAGYNEAGPLLKELLNRWQLQRDQSDQVHQQMLEIAGESEVIRQHSIQQTQSVGNILSHLATIAPSLSPEIQVAVANSVEKLKPCPALTNTVKQIQAIAILDLQTDLDDLFKSNLRIAAISQQDQYAVSCCVRSVLSRHLAQLLYLPIGPVAPERDGDGYWSHPAIALQPDGWDESTPTSDIKAWYASQGLEVSIVNLEDQDGDLLDRIWDDKSTLTEWDPVPPDGDGWFLFSIFDSEEGFHAEFARRIAD